MAQKGRLPFADSRWPLARSGAAIASIAAEVYGLSFPRSRRNVVGDLVVFTGLPRWAYPRGGLCVGNVFLTGPVPSRQVIEHERRHVTQWRKYGMAMPLLYWLAGSNPHSNRFEIEAGLADGGYSRGDQTAA